LALVTYGAADGCGHTFLVVWQGFLLFFIDSLSNGLHGANQRAFMIVCRSPEDVKSYLDCMFRVRYRFPVREPEGKEKKKLEAKAAAAEVAAAAAAAQRAAKRNNADTPESEMQWGSEAYTKYQIELSYFKLRALGAAEKGQRKRQSIGAAEQEKDKATELAQPQSNAENPTVLRKELQQKDRVMENLIQSHDELQAKLKQVFDQLAEEQRGGQERMRVAKETQKNLQGQIQSLNADLRKAHDRAKDKARKLGDAQKQLLSNRGLLRQRDTEVKNLKERLKQQSNCRSGIWGRGPKMRASPPLMRGNWKNSRSSLRRRRPRLSHC
jgi:chromosome segregation ATPase